jgi:hypothetical protein
MRLEFKEKVVTVQIEAPWYDQHYLRHKLCILSAHPIQNEKVVNAVNYT